jgi:hypothetical protein
MAMMKHCRPVSAEQVGEVNGTGFFISTLTCKYFFKPFWDRLFAELGKQDVE